MNKNKNSEINKTNGNNRYQLYNKNLWILEIRMIFKCPIKKFITLKI